MDKGDDDNRRNAIKQTSSLKNMHYQTNFPDVGFRVYYCVGLGIWGSGVVVWFLGLAIYGFPLFQASQTCSD